MDVGPQRAPTFIRPAVVFDLPRLLEVAQYRDLLWIWVWREIRVRYRQSAVGLGWAVIQPVMMLVVFTFLFGRIAGVSSEGFPYPVFAFAGLLPWQYFQRAVTAASGSLTGNAGVLTKVYFPRAIMPLTAVMVALVDFLLALLVLVALMLWFRIMPSWQVLAVVPLLLLTAAFALGLSLWMAAFAIDFRDVQHALPFGLQIWMYLTPVVYPLAEVPESLQVLYLANPAVGIVAGFRWALLGVGEFPLEYLAVTVAVTIGTLYFGTRYFTRQERSLADRI